MPSSLVILILRFLDVMTSMALRLEHLRHEDISNDSDAQEHVTQHTKVEERQYRFVDQTEARWYEP